MRHRFQLCWLGTPLPPNGLGTLEPTSTVGTLRVFDELATHAFGGGENRRSEQRRSLEPPTTGRLPRQ